MTEFDLIARYFEPLAHDPGAEGLRDDVARLSLAAGEQVLLTADGLVAGIHFLPHDPPDLLARKLLRVNLSDLAAKGARARHYLLVACFPRFCPESYLAAFAAGLAADQAAYGISLLGGDTIATEGPASFAVTMLGTTPAGVKLSRGGARPGDGLFVTGSIGAAALGLRVLTRRAEGLDPVAAEAGIAAYRLPEPRSALGPRLLGIATASLDVSDGLLADAGHIAAASACAVRIEAARVPLAPPVAAALRRGLMSRTDALTGGDDYEILFTAPSDTEDRLARLGAETGIAITRIGRVEPGAGVVLLDEDGRDVTPARRGYDHFA